MTEATILADLTGSFSGETSELKMENDQLWGRVQKTAVIKVLGFLKHKRGFDVLMDLTCVDYLRWEDKTDRFEIVYNLYSTASRERVILRAAVSGDDAVIDSVTSLWPGANWLEREVWDMFGIRFSGHPGLKRILLYEEFQGHALRKDYPYNKRQPLIGPKN